MTNKLITILLCACTAWTLAAAETSAPIVPPGWDAALAGDAVMERLIKVSAPQVKGAHDAEFVCVGDRAYIVEHDNDVEPGHGAGAAQYCVLSIVNLKTLKVEKTIPMAKSEQVFNNVTLPRGMCFVPRIIRKDEHTLRTYFCSQPAKEQALTWYRDFDLRTMAFETRIHKAKLKTAAGVFDMEPRHFHADAAAQGFTKPLVNGGLYIFDSFKEFDGRRYVAINNFPGKQNALARLHDDFATFEIVGHYNEPQSQQLSESAVNRLPDGTWMAICRNDGGNYHFTTSKDGRKWSVGEPMPFVPNGANAKPTFDKFGGVYYLGWQEATKIQGANRSVFNVDISRDGKTWQRKYRFETPESFQYPTFHEHAGTIWLTVTQGHKGSSDRIMFGKLETLGDGGEKRTLDADKKPAQPLKTDERKPVLIESKRIWDKAKHCAFTDLTRFRDQWFCCFREGENHAPGDGKVRVLRSPDGVAWSSAALIAEDGVDLRDPKFSIKPDGQLMIVAGGTVWDKESKTPLAKTKQPRVIFSRDGITWTKPAKVMEEGQWLWRVDWHEGKAYGISYSYLRAAHPDPKMAEAAETNGPVPPGPFPWKAKLVTSTDGLKWETVTHLDVPGRPNEATARIRPDGEMVAMVRRERGNYFGWIGSSKPPYRKWSWHETEHRFGGPNFIVLPDGSLIASGRSYRKPFSTVIASMDREHYDIALILPSGGSDTGYPGMVWHKDELWVSYYSSHEDKNGNPPPNRHVELPSAIYLARVRFQK